MIKRQFIGRKIELNQLNACLNSKNATLAVCRGRRRIGKSTLIKHFATRHPFIELYGLAPRENLSNIDQLTHFGELLGLAFKLPAFKFDHWNVAFGALAQLTAKGRYIILLDEISWMGAKDKDFAAKLKGAWDTRFKNNSQLILVLCGSVTSWIDDNILNDKGFVGRISLTITLKELPLCDANQFWGKRHFVSAYEKLKLLCVTGGVPRYLEEINVKETAEQNLKRLCFTRSGLLFNEFDKIFKDIFGKRFAEYVSIVRLLVNGALELNEICQRLHIKPTGTFSKKLASLELAGFITRDYTHDLNSNKKSASKYRLSDNYLRFYLKYIEPKKELIEQGLYDTVHLENLKEWEVILGLQLQNLVLNNLSTIALKLKIPFESIVSAGPYFQKKTQRKAACQIDLLIRTKYTLYLCEIKYRKNIDTTVISEVLTKIEKLNYKKTLSIRPILIYAGELASSVTNSDFFDTTISLADLLEETS